MIFEQCRLSAVWHVGKISTVPERRRRRGRSRKKKGMKGRNIEGGIAIVVSVKILICIMQFYDNCSVVIAKLVINQFESANLLCRVCLIVYEVNKKE